MALILKSLIEQLDITVPEMLELRSRVIASLGNAVIMRDILDRQCENRNLPNCYSCDDEGICLIMTGIAHLNLGQINTAIKELENGNQHSRSKGETWNSIIGLILLGKVHEQSGNSHLAHIEYKKALQLITENYKRVHVNDYAMLARARALENELNAEVTQPLLTHSSAPKPVQSANSNVILVGGSKAYLCLFSIPIYGIVTAGADGEVHIDPFENTSTTVGRIELEGCAFDVFSLGGTASRDRQITLIPQESYGWAKVRGLSMNGWDIPLNENDFVLFRESRSADHNDFVIISSPDPSGDLKYIVKKYDEYGRQYLSKSTDTSQLYDPIPMDDDHKNVGVVIAIAKPAIK